MNRLPHSPRGPVHPGRGQALRPSIRPDRRPHGVMPRELLGLARSLRHTHTFHEALAAVTQSPPAGTWHWRTLLKSDCLRCGLLLLSPCARIPLHDHPGMRAALLVVAGRIDVERYDLLAFSGPRRRLARLRRLGIERLGCGDHSLIEGSSGNIHGLNNKNDSCALLLDALWHRGEAPKRHIYLPVSGPEGPEMDAVVVEEPRLRRFGIVASR